MTIAIVGLGPAGLDRLDDAALAALNDPAATVVLRTVEHPAASALAARRPVVSCDDLYEAAAEFDELYAAVAERVLSAPHPVVYAVPGSALVGERAVRLIRQQADSVTLYPGESFIDLALGAVGLDPIADGLQILDARDLPDPLPLHLPTLFTQLDTPGTAAALSDRLGQVLNHDAAVTVLSRLGSPDEVVTQATVQSLPTVPTDPRTSAFLSPQQVGWLGLVHTNRILREECPWDRKQTHHSLLKHLVEEAYETVDAVSALPETSPQGDPDFGAYAAVEEELGDLLLQVVFHATMAREAGAFDVEEVAEGIRRKLVSRHPHVFGDLDLASAAEVEANWEKLKSAEKRRESPMDDVPSSLPGLARADKIQRRAASVGFDWTDVAPVVAKLREEIAELEAVIGESETEVAAELGDILFATVNVARHLEIDSEAAMRAATARFEARFRWMESQLDGSDMAALSPAQFDGLWTRAKEAETAAGKGGAETG